MSNNETKAFMVFKAIVRTHGWLVTQLITHYIAEMPERNVIVDEENNILWFKPHHRPGVKKLGGSTYYWKAVVDSQNANLLMKKTIKDEEWYAVNFILIEELISNMDEDDAEAEMIAASEELEKLN